MIGPNVRSTQDCPGEPVGGSPMPEYYKHQRKEGVSLVFPFYHFWSDLKPCYFSFQVRH